MRTPSFTLPSERLLELAARCAEAEIRGRERNAESYADFGCSHLFELREQEDFALVRANLRDQGLELADGVRLLGVSVGTRVA